MRRFFSLGVRSLLSLIIYLNWSRVTIPVVSGSYFLNLYFNKLAVLLISPV